MSLSPLVSLLITFVFIHANVHCDVLTTKCCDYGEELNANLTICQPINITGRPYSVYVSNATFSYVTFDADANFELGSERRGKKKADFLSWLPEGLKDAVAPQRLDIVVGRPDACSNAKTVRLELPRDGERVRWLANGSLLLDSSTAHGLVQSHVFSAGEFCSDAAAAAGGGGARAAAILICGACERVRCVKKCCPPGEAVVCGGGCRCRPHPAPWNPFHPDLPPPEEDFAFEVVVDANVTCPHDYATNYNMFVGRPPYMLKRFWEKYWREGEMCSDTVVGVLAEPGRGMRRCMRKPPFLKVLDNWLHVPEALVLGVAVLTLLLVPREKLSAYSHVHDLSLFWHAACLLARSLLWTVYLKAWWSCYLTREWCITIMATTLLDTKDSIFVYFFSVAATLWLNVLCINMVCGFWKPPGRAPSLGRKASDSSLMFVWYSLYAWGVTAAMTGFSAFMWYSLEAPSSLLRPTLFETRTCFIEEEGDGKMATFAYYYGPVSWLLVVNAALFVATSARVRYLRSSGGALKGKESATSGSSFRNKWSVVIYIKLLWLMGVVEMALEMVTWVSNDHIYYTVVVVTCLDVLRAVAIFVFCVCNRRALLALRERFRACAPGRLRKRWASGERPWSGACARARLLCAPWVARGRRWKRRCCWQRPKPQLEPPVGNGRYVAKATPEVIAHM